MLYISLGFVCLLGVPGLLFVILELVFEAPVPVINSLAQASELVGLVAILYGPCSALHAYFTITTAGLGEIELEDINDDSGERMISPMETQRSITATRRSFLNLHNCEWGNHTI